MEAETIQRGIAEARLQGFEKLKAIVDTAEKEGRGFTAEEKQEKDRLHGELDGLEVRESVLKEQVAVSKSTDEARAAMERFTRPDRETPNGGSGDERFLAWARGEGPKAIEVDMRGLSREIRRLGGDQIEARVLTDGTLPAASGGGATVPISFRAQLYQHLTFNTAMRQTRATILTTESGEPIQLPKTTAHPASGTIIPEGNTLQASDPTLGQGTIASFKYGNIVQISTELLTDSAVDILGYLAERFGISLANGSGSHYVKGTGSGQPTGFLVGAGTVGKFQGTTLSVGGAPQSNDIFETYHAIIPPYRRNAEWFMSDSALKAIRELKSTTGQYLWSPGGLAGGVPSTLLDKPYVVDPAMPAVGTSATSIAFGDFSAYFIRDVAGFRFERSDDFAFGTDLVSFRAILRTDGQMLDSTGAIGYFIGGTA